MTHTNETLTLTRASRLFSDQPLIGWGEYVANRVRDGKITDETGAAWIASGPQSFGNYAHR